MTLCLFATDLHGAAGRYRALFDEIAGRRPAAVFLGGDLLPGLEAATGVHRSEQDFVSGFLAAGFERLRTRLGSSYPRVFVILGNDDARFYESSMLDVAADGLWQYAHDRRLALGEFTVYGYAFVPPSPFALKDWERYDVSRFVDPGCVSPEEGRRSVPVAPHEVRYATIAQDLERMTGERDVSRAVFLFHSPPYDTALDRAALDGRTVDHVPLDVHVGSIAIRRFVEARQPLLTLHGHVHESARLTGAWRERLGRTWMLGAAHDGPELALVEVDLERPTEARRHLVPPRD